MRSLLCSSRLVYLAVAYAALLALVVYTAWPGAYPIEGAEPPSTATWWGYANTYLLGFMMLLTAAFDDGKRGSILPRHWIQYTDAHPVSVVAASLCGSMVRTIFWLLLSLPTCVIAQSVSGWSTRVVALFGYWFLLGTAVGAVGTWLNTVVTEGNHRMWVATTVWPAILVSGKMFVDVAEGTVKTVRMPWSPLSVVEPLSRPVETGSAVDDLALDMLLAPGGILLVFALMTVVALSRWRSRSREETQVRNG